MSNPLIQVARTIGAAEQRVQWIEATDAQLRLVSGILTSLPQMRAAWTMGIIEAQNPQVQAFGGHHLTNNNVAVFGDNTAAPYVEFDGVNQYLSKADAGAGDWADILGTEPYIVAAQRGLTFGGWFRFDRLTNREFLIGKSTGGFATSSYWIDFRGDLANDPFTFNVSDGAANFTVTHTPTAAIDTAKWYFVVGRYDPSTEIKFYLGAGGALESSTLAVGIPAALNDSATAFTIGAYPIGTFWLDGRASCCFLCTGMLSDSWVRCLYSQMRSIFRV